MKMVRNWLLFGSSSRRHASSLCDWSSDVCSSDLRDGAFLANYANINLSDAINRLPGISRVQIFGAGQYAMRIWVRPDQLAKLNITVPEIINRSEERRVGKECRSRWSPYH